MYVSIVFGEVEEVFVKDGSKMETKRVTVFSSYGSQTEPIECFTLFFKCFILVWSTNVSTGNSEMDNVENSCVNGKCKCALKVVKVKSSNKAFFCLKNSSRDFFSPCVRSRKYLEWGTNISLT